MWKNNTGGVGAVQGVDNITLPQFEIIGHKTLTTLEELATGKKIIMLTDF